VVRTDLDARHVVKVPEGPGKRGAEGERERESLVEARAHHALDGRNDRHLECESSSLCLP